MSNNIIKIILSIIVFIITGCGTLQNDLEIKKVYPNILQVEKGEQVVIMVNVSCNSPIDGVLSLIITAKNKSVTPDLIAPIEFTLKDDTNAEILFAFNPKKSGEYLISVDGFKDDPNLKNNERKIKIMVTEEVGVITTQFGDMVVEFFEKAAPMHTESFKLHAKSGYYKGTTFHRVIPGFMIQGGDPNTKGDDRSQYGRGGNAAKFFGVGVENDSTTWNIPAEFNDLKHKHGILSMARSAHPNSGGSQFFVCAGDITHLDGQYTVFGQVIEGHHVIDQIVNLPRDGRDNPNSRVEMNVHIEKRDK